MPRALLLPAVLGALALGCVAPPAHAALTVEPHTTIVGGTGSSGSGAVGDVNGDGRADVFVGDCGTATVVFGAAAKATVSAASPGDRGITLTNLPGCAETFANLGDVNGDGRSDIGMSVFGPFQSTARELYVIFGRATAATLDVRSLGSAGAVLVEPENVSGGGMIARVGDVNGDGLADVGFTGSVAAPSAEYGYEDVAGVLFGRRGMSGDVVLTQAFDGLRITSSTRPVCCGQVQALGDLNGDGRDDVVAMVSSPYSTTAVVYGRASAATIDVDVLGDAGRTIDGFAPSAAGDVNGDGLRDLVSSGIALSSRTGALFSASRQLELTASAGGQTRAADAHAAGDLNGDGRGDVTTGASYGQLRGSYLTGWPKPLTLNYLVAGVSEPKKIDLRVPGNAALRLDAVPDGTMLVGGLRFTGSGGQLIGITSAPERRVVLYDIVDRPAVADRTPPTLSGVSISTSVLVSSLPWGPKSAVMRYSVSERAYMELEVRRNGALVTWSKGSVAPGADSWTISVGPPSKQLPRGSYTVTMKATDLAGNAAPARTLSFQVL